MRADGHREQAEPPATDPPDSLATVRAENERLCVEVDLAVAAAREAEAEAGRLRGTIAEMQVQLIRARQDQEGFQTWRARQRMLELRRRVGRRIGRSVGTLRAR